MILGCIKAPAAGTNEICYYFKTKQHLLPWMAAGLFLGQQHFLLHKVPFGLKVNTGTSSNAMLGEHRDWPNGIQCFSSSFSFASLKDTIWAEVPFKDKKHVLILKNSPTGEVQHFTALWRTSFVFKNQLLCAIKLFPSWGDPTRLTVQYKSNWKCIRWRG